MIIDKGHFAGIPVGMCGEMAGNGFLSPLLCGLGLDEFSMDPQSVLAVRRNLRMVSYAECGELADAVLQLDESEAIKTYMKDWMERHERKMNEMGKIPMIAIIGRPNVGKSTLFNRLLGKRRAITSPEPGVTRDAIEERWYLGNHPVTLVDSGGIKQEKTGLDDLVTDKSISLFASSDAILFLMDCTEVTGEDHQIMEDLRPYTDKVVLVVNKVDDQRRENLVWDYFQYGFQRVVGISAAHGLGMEELEDCLCGMLDLTTEQQAPEEEATVKIAIMGKPNTGKSTLTNLLVGDEVSLVSDIPGTTRDVIRSRFTYKNTLFSVMDTAGIRRKGKVSDDVEYYSVNRSIKAIEESDVVLLMVDSEEGISEQDKKIANLVVRRGRGLSLC